MPLVTCVKCLDWREAGSETLQHRGQEELANPGTTDYQVPLWVSERRETIGCYLSSLKGTETTGFRITAHTHTLPKAAEYIHGNQLVLLERDLAHNCSASLVAFAKKLPKQIYHTGGYCPLHAGNLEKISTCLLKACIEAQMVRSKPFLEVATQCRRRLTVIGPLLKKKKKMRATQPCTWCFYWTTAAFVLLGAEVSLGAASSHQKWVCLCVCVCVYT